MSKKQTIKRSNCGDVFDEINGKSLERIDEAESSSALFDHIRASKQIFSMRDESFDMNSATVSSRKAKDRAMKPIKRSRRCSDHDENNSEVGDASKSENQHEQVSDACEEMLAVHEELQQVVQDLENIPDLIDENEPSDGATVTSNASQSEPRQCNESQESNLETGSDLVVYSLQDEGRDRSPGRLDFLRVYNQYDLTSSEESISSPSLWIESNTTTSESVSPIYDSAEDEYSHDEQLDDTDCSCDSDLFLRNTNISESPHVERALKDVLSKPKSSYTFNLASQLLRREYGFSANKCYSLRNGVLNSFNMDFYSSRFAVERMKVAYQLEKHKGCVNSLHFNCDGSLLCSGSDDTRIVIWNWAKGQPKYHFRSGHTQNIFQAKFVNTCDDLEIISSGLDGEVRRSIVKSSGGKPITSALYSHRGPVHKVVISPNNPHEIISAGEDGRLFQCDLRCHTEIQKVFQVYCRLYSVSHHPFAPEICVSGTSNSVRIYDKRKFEQAVHEFYPRHLKERRGKMVTCSVYNNRGDEILASYGDDNIYLFNRQNYSPGEYAHCYKGHLNQQTIKGVNFFGPNSEYVISGSDCGHVFFWDKNTEAILNFLKGDSGVVNCLEPQISMPILAVSGLDNTVKVVAPGNSTPIDSSRLESVVRLNLRHNHMGNLPGSDNRFFSLILREFMERRNFDEYDTDESEEEHRWTRRNSSSGEREGSSDVDI